VKDRDHVFKVKDILDVLNEAIAKNPEVADFLVMTGDCNGGNYVVQEPSVTYFTDQGHNHVEFYADEDVNEETAEEFGFDLDKIEKGFII
jgi:hypothetical protein